MEDSVRCEIYTYISPHGVHDTPYFVNNMLNYKLRFENRFFSRLGFGNQKQK